VDDRKFEQSDYRFKDETFIGIICKDRTSFIQNF